MEEFGIRRILSSAYHPESQGALERFHQTMKSMLKKYCLERNYDWDKDLPLVLFAIRSAKNKKVVATFSLGHISLVYCIIIYVYVCIFS